VRGLLHERRDTRKALAQAVGNRAPFRVRLLFHLLSKGGADVGGDYGALLGGLAKSYPPGGRAVR
jgi:hypothetical protein